MNLVGKIFVVLILVMSVLFMAFAMALYATHRNWREMVINEQASPDKPSRFIRMMILPRELVGKSSIQYVNEEDKAKPKSQQYKIYADAPISFGARK